MTLDELKVLLADHVITIEEQKKTIDMLTKANQQLAEEAKKEDPE